MPNNWKTYKLSEIAKTNSSTIGRDCSFEEILYLDTGSVTEGRYDLPQALPLSEAPSRAKRVVKHNDIIYSTVRPNQRHYGLIKKPKDNLIVSTGFCVITPKQVEPKFLYYSLTTSEMTDYLHTIAEGSTTTYPSIKPSVLEELEIKLPPLKEQTQIANILSTIDDKIENNLATNKTLEDMAMALYKHWFVDFGPFQDGEFVDSELGLIPKGWEVKRLEELGRMYYGKMPKKDKIQTTGFPLYSGYRLVGHYPEFNCKKGKVIVLARGVGGTGDIKMTKTDLFLTNISICIKNELEIISDLILFYILKSTGLHYLRTGSAQPQITINDLNSVQLIIPSKEIQNEFLESFKSLIDKKEENIIENENLSKLRDTLLPKLISGEVRLKEFREQVENIITNAVK
tara:strand:- start:6811 stop:8010 length:1200 start_codon:yes stop_codon:yes gene_type:complete